MSESRRLLSILASAAILAIGAEVRGGAEAGAEICVRDTVLHETVCFPEPSESCDSLYFGTMPVFPRIPVCAFAGAWRDSSRLEDPLIRRRCVGSFAGPMDPPVEERARTVTVRFRRDRRAEARRDFGGYRLYRIVNRFRQENGRFVPDTSYAMLIRRFSRQTGDERTWSFSVVDTTTLEFKCRDNSIVATPKVVHDSIVTFVDPDSNGNYIKVCRVRDPQEGTEGRCISRFDSVFVLKTPPGPHDGFFTWYAVTYEGRNQGLDGNYADLFVPDTTGRLGPCTNPLDPNTCPNLNHKAMNLTAEPVSPTGGPTRNLERVVVVPNPYRAREAWDRPGVTEVHFVNLPREALIRIYTVAGDLVAELRHNDAVHDFERWNLKNQNQQDVASGIYMYRVESTVGGQPFSFQDRFVVIR
jgi:hypothetical protein